MHLAGVCVGPLGFELGGLVGIFIRLRTTDLTSNMALWHSDITCAPRLRFLCILLPGNVQGLSSLGLSTYVWVLRKQ